MTRPAHWLLAFLLAASAFPPAARGSVFPPAAPHARIYLYAHANPVMNVDPSGRMSILSVGAATAIHAPMRYREAVSKAFLGIRISRLMAGRSFMKWGWLTGGLGAGVAYFAQDTQFGMDVQLMLQSNPTGSQYAYENFKCVEFAADAMTYFRTRTGKKQPQRITYDLKPGMGPGFIMANFGFFKDQVVSENGHHEGVIYDGMVFDNNVPFGTMRPMWEEGYELFIRGHGEMSIGESARLGFGEIKVE